MSTIVILIGLFLCGLLTNALFLWIGTKCARIPRVTFHWALVGALMIGLVFASFTLLFLWVPLDSYVPTFLAGWIQLGVALGVTLASLKFLFKTSLLRAFISWLLTLIGSAGLITLVYLVVIPYITAAYIVPTQAMAPTLLAPHKQGVCPHCGQTTTVGFHPGFGSRTILDPMGMCGSCQQAGKATNVGPAIYPPDRFMVNKLLTPRRWDLVVCRSLENPPILFVKRLVGLPGEEITIKKGSVWINGTKQEFPAEIAKLTLFANPHHPEEEREQGERSWRLGGSELFVLGDFSLQSLDSRDFGPLLVRNLEGVVSIVYWPLSRWHVIR